LYGHDVLKVIETVVGGGPVRDVGAVVDADEGFPVHRSSGDAGPTTALGEHWGGDEQSDCHNQ
jgi:hypothetical protein